MNQKNYDPFMHSAEHILNGVMVKKFGKGRSFSQHIERKKSKCDYKGFKKNLTKEELHEIEREVNKIVDMNLKVTEEYISVNEAEKKYNIEKLPEGAGENIRIVKIGNFDACPCIGPHVNSTSEIGKVKIISSDFINDILRIRFKRILNN